LGITIDAVRKRAERGQLPYEREGGRLYILLDDELDTDATESRPNVEGESSALMFEMRARIRLLEEELEAWREESRRKDTIIMNMTEAMKALSPPTQDMPPEASESTETAESPGLRDRPFTEEEQPSSQRSWWRRMFGG
jgi:hypothetical protein